MCRWILSFDSTYNLMDQVTNTQQMLTVFYIWLVLLDFGGGYATVLALPILVLYLEFNNI